MSWSIFGHEWAVSLLERDLAQQRLRHAYLFTGPNGVGKRTLVMAFAQALLCVHNGPPAPPAPSLFAMPAAPPLTPPCGQCRACQLVLKGTHPDLLTVAPVESGKKVRTAKIKIEAVRQLIYDLNLKPIEAKCRVARLLRFEAANTESMNALLKTLEEPPPNVFLLLTAERADDLLPTIVSRCEVLNLRPLPNEVVQSALITHWQVPAERATLLAALAQGRLGWAVRMHSDEEALAERTQQLDDLVRLVRASRVERFAYAEKLAKSGSLEAIRETLDVWVGFWRDVLLTGTQATAPLANPDRAPDLTQIAARIPPAAAAQVIQDMRRTGELLERNVNTRLALEVMLLDWPRGG